MDSNQPIVTLNDDASKRKVFIVDDHALVREWLTNLINRQSDLVVCGEAVSAPEASEKIANAQPDVAVVDILLKDSSGIDLIKSLKRSHPETAVLVLSMFDEAHFAERVLRAGAMGYVMKQETSRKVVEAIRQILQGQLYVSENVRQMLAAQPLDGNSVPSGLSVERYETGRQPGSGEAGTRTMNTLTNYVRRHTREVVAGLCALSAFAVGVADWATGPEISPAAFYLIPVLLAAWYAGRRPAFLIVILTNTIWYEVDIHEHAFSHASIPIANAIMRVAAQFAIVLFVARARRLTDNLDGEARVKSAALLEEIELRRGLEGQLMDTAERERQRIGQDIHDDFCQQLAAIGMAARQLEGELTADAPAHAAHSREIAIVINSLIGHLRQVAKGLYPVTLETDGLSVALGELAETVRSISGIPCEFVCDQPILPHDRAMDIHLFRIAQEAVNNALKHGRPTAITIRLDPLDGAITLSVKDDGCGIPRDKRPNGIGVFSMRCRASVIGGTLVIQNADGGGTIMICHVPQCDRGKSQDGTEDSD
jgi:signal transduction histidine kinase/DNA-binding NarL/FixJ family response regulator